MGNKRLHQVRDAPCWRHCLLGPMPCTSISLQVCLQPLSEAAKNDRSHFLDQRPGIVSLVTGHSRARTKGDSRATARWWYSCTGTVPVVSVRGSHQTSIKWPLGNLCAGFDWKMKLARMGFVSLGSVQYLFRLASVVSSHLKFQHHVYKVPDIAGGPPCNSLGK